MELNNTLKAILTELYKGELANLFNEISNGRIKEKIGGKWIEINGNRYFQEAQWGECTYTHNDSIKFNIGKLKVYHIDNSIEYLFQEGDNCNLDWI